MPLYIYVEKPNEIEKVAERRGFEPRAPVKVQLISSQPHSATLAPLPIGQKKGVMAEEVGFEPTDPCESTVFKTAAFDHSAIPPTTRNAILFSFLQRVNQEIPVNLILENCRLPSPSRPCYDPIGENSTCAQGARFRDRVGSLEKVPSASQRFLAEELVGRGTFASTCRFNAPE